MRRALVVGLVAGRLALPVTRSWRVVQTTGQSTGSVRRAASPVTTVRDKPVPHYCGFTFTPFCGGRLTGRQRRYVEFAAMARVSAAP